MEQLPANGLLRLSIVYIGMHLKTHTYPVNNKPDWSICRFTSSKEVKQSANYKMSQEFSNDR